MKDLKRKEKIPACEDDESPRAAQRARTTGTSGGEDGNRSAGAPGAGTLSIQEPVIPRQAPPRSAPVSSQPQDRATPPRQLDHHKQVDTTGGDQGYGNAGSSGTGTLRSGESPVAAAQGAPRSSAPVSGQAQGHPTTAGMGTYGGEDTSGTPRPRIGGQQPRLLNLFPCPSEPISTGQQPGPGLAPPGPGAFNLQPPVRTASQSRHGLQEQAVTKVCRKHGAAQFFADICVKCALEAQGLPKLPHPQQQQQQQQPGVRKGVQQLQNQPAIPVVAPAGVVGQRGEAPGAIQLQHSAPPQAHHGPVAPPHGDILDFAAQFQPPGTVFGPCPHCGQPAPMYPYPQLHVCVCYTCALYFALRCGVCGLHG